MSGMWAGAVSGMGLGRELTRETREGSGKRAGAELKKW